MCSEGKKTKIQSMELYGFFAWNLSSLLFLVFLIWAYVPEHILLKWGIYYMPSKYLAVCIPTYICMSVWLGILAYAFLSQYFSHPRDSYLSMQDRATILKHPEIAQPDNQAVSQEELTSGDTSGSPSKGELN